MSKPRIAIIGSCVSRDVFRQDFTPNYKDEFQLVCDVYQSSLPSLAREDPISLSDSLSLRHNYLKTITNEFDGCNLDRIVRSMPNFILLDFYADIQFGSTQVDGRYVTRNHMAFTDPDSLDAYFNDDKKKFPIRDRFESQSQEENNYSLLVCNSIDYIMARIREKNQNAQIIINSARFASAYESKLGELKLYAKPDRLKTKNKHWKNLDEIVISKNDAQQIVYPDELTTGNENHIWGLNPVHYGQEYYNFLWQKLLKLTK